MVDTIKVGISSGCLFELRQLNSTLAGLSECEKERYLAENTSISLKNGAAFSLINKLCNLKYSGESLVEIYLISRKKAGIAKIIQTNLNQRSLDIKQAIFTNGQSIIKAVKENSIDLFLSTNTCDVKEVLACQIPAAKLLAEHNSSRRLKEIRLAFDGDSCIFGSTVDELYEKEGIDAVYQHEERMRSVPIEPGPLKSFLEKIDQLKHKVNKVRPGLIQTALITARSPQCSPRVINTLKSWGVFFDEMFFMSGDDKNEAIKRFSADMFFDDRMDNCIPARRYSSAAHVPWGVTNGQYT